MLKKPRNSLSWLYGRETGLPSLVGERDMMSNMLYSSFGAVDLWDPQKLGQDNHRGIFNFDFSTDGSVLVAACEGKSFLVFDPNNHKLIKTRRRAHVDCVNCVRFLDTRSFVTCSDDTTVVLWDLRFLKNKVRVFAGHTSWVKNIEYASSQGLLITSGFDGSVYTWNINNYSKDEECKRKFHTEGLMRCKLTPDESKLVLSTSKGYLMIIHDLDLPQLDINMDNYKMETSGGRQKSITSSFYSLFKRPTNRLEIINEFPAVNDAENIASLQVHPQGWCVVSRNTSKDDAAEWTCVHDIHTSPTLREEEEEEEEEDMESQTPSSNTAAETESSARTHPPRVRKRESSSARCRHHPYLAPPRPAHPHRANGQGPADGVFTVTSPEASAPSTSSVEDLSSDSEPSSGEMSASDRDCCNGEDCAMCIRRKETENLGLYQYFLRAQWNDSLHAQYVPEPERLNPIDVLDNVYAGPLRRPHTRQMVSRNSFILDFEQFIRSFYRRREKLTDLYLSQPRLIYCQQEPNVGRGFIKEQCFSADGRLIMSPCGTGVRLLAFDEQCRELCDCERGVAGKPRHLHEMKKLQKHPHVVLTCCCSPTHSLFVSGSLDGSVSFMMPRP